ncbi:hypothetical protein KXW38_001465, partial [Aspergillus fumigatus]
IGAAAHLAVFSTLPTLEWGTEHFGPRILVEDLVVNPLRFENFEIVIPDGPGLGITLDQDRLLQTFDAMAQRLGGMPHLRRLGQLFDATVLIEVDGNELYLTFEHGCVVQIAQGPSKKISWHFALRASADALQRFWQPIPRPGYHDIF